MADTRWLERLLETTRGQVLTLLRRSERTTGELAESLDLTHNAIRAQLTALERDGLVRMSGRRREGVGKPAYIYQLTPEAEKLFPSAYDQVLIELIHALSERLGAEETERVLRATGRRTASAQDVPDSATLRERLDIGLALLADMGGDGEVVQKNGRLGIRGYACPLGAVVSHHPGACAIVEELLTALLGVEVDEVCHKGERPRCRFEVAAQPED